MQDYTDTTNLTAAFLVSTMGIFGVFCNGLIVYAFKKDKRERSSFNLICVFRASINLFVLVTTFLVCFLPTIILGSSPFHPLVEALLIIFSNTFYLGNEYQTVLVAANRFCALFFPVYYSKFFGLRSTLLALIVIYGYRFVALLVDAFFFYDEASSSEVDCFIFFSPEKLTWTLTDDPSCSAEENILLVVSLTFLFVFILNIAIFTRIVMYQKARTKEGKTLSAIERKNVVLFVQTVLQDSLYLIDLTFTFKLSALSNSRFWAFISRTFVWECLHCLDGLIMMLFHEELSFVKSCFRSRASGSASETMQTAPSLPRIE